MKAYDTLSEALDDLKKRGYIEDFNLHPHCLACTANKREFAPGEFKVVEVY
jgi:hypothetical protein